jgi:hypothetical protein
MAVLAWAAMAFNSAYYEFWVNYDPQGDAQLHELRVTREVFQYTSGVLCGQFLSIVAGVTLGRRERPPVALAAACGLGVLLAGVTVAVAFPMAAALHGWPSWDPVLVRLLVFELVAYPLCAAAGAGLGALTRNRVLLTVLGVAWWIGASIGLTQDDSFALPGWLLLFPPLAAGAAIALAGLSMDVWTSPAVPVGDWGYAAADTMLTSLAAAAILLNLPALLRPARSTREHEPSPRPRP